MNNFDLEESPTPPGQSQPTTPWIAVTPDYFRVLGLTLAEGRLLNEQDVLRPDLEAVVVDRAWASRFFPGASAVGKRFREGGCSSCPWTEVVGVVSTVKYVGLDEPDQGTVYAPWSYAPWSASFTGFVIVRTRTDPQTLEPSIRQVLHELDPTVPLSSVATMDDLVEQSLLRPQSLSFLVGGVALVALVLSIVGIYGVMSYYVQGHARDISIRIALGGSASDVVRLVLGQGMRVVVGGVLAGLLAAYGLTRLMSALLFGVAPSDAVTFSAVGVLMLAVALVACLVPARRAIGLQPATVLRNE
jgi:putative ABC transport system permease protein